MNGVLQTAPAVTVLANGIRIDGISVPAGGVTTLAYTARVNAFADLSAEGTIENTVTVTGGQPDRGCHGRGDAPGGGSGRAPHRQGP